MSIKTSRASIMQLAKKKKNKSRASNEIYFWQMLFEEQEKTQILKTSIYTVGK